MRRLVFTAAALALVLAAQGEERRKLSPLAIYGNWLGTQGALPPDCEGDGFFVGFGANNAENFRMTVRPRKGGVLGEATSTEYTVHEPPEGAPIRLEIFLTSDKGDLGIDQLTGSTLELVPAGPDKTYPATALYLRRC